MIGFDYTARIDPAALIAAKCSAVFRYTTRQDWPKSIARPEVLELGSIKMPLVCNFESTADRMRGAGPAGHADAVEQSGNLAVLGIPPQAVRSWFSADWDVQATEVILCLDYLEAAAEVLGGKQFVGCYGGWRLVQAAADAGFAIWQTSAWSGGRWDPRAVARQTGQQQYVGGVQVDVNQIIDLAGLGAWGGPNSGGTVILGQDDLDAIAARVYAYGREDVNLATGVMHNVPLGNLAHGSWVALNDPKTGLLTQMAQVKTAVTQQPMTATALAQALAPVLAPLLPAAGTVDPAPIAAAAATAVVTALEQHNFAGLDAQHLADALEAEVTALRSAA